MMIFVIVIVMTIEQNVRAICYFADLILFKIHITTSLNNLLLEN